MAGLVKIEPGGTNDFHPTASKLIAKYGERVTVTIVGPIAPELYDADETGPMFEVLMPDGEKVHVFEDELGEEGGI